jgi:ABC-type phosphate/phosphonate transport system substrate-binding protein
LDESLKYRIQAALLQMHNHRSAAYELQKGLIERFVPVTDEHYAGILEMLGLVEINSFVNVGQEDLYAAI